MGMGVWEVGFARVFGVGFWFFSYECHWLVLKGREELGRCIDYGLCSDRTTMEMKWDERERERQWGEEVRA